MLVHKKDKDSSKTTINIVLVCLWSTLIVFSATLSILTSHFLFNKLNMHHPARKISSSIFIKHHQRPFTSLNLVIMNLLIILFQTTSSLTFLILLFVVILLLIDLTNLFETNLIM